MTEVESSNKLMRLRVDFGDHERTILAGIKQEREPTLGEIEGRQALFVVNLAPRKMAGELSEGMLFDLGYEDGITPCLSVPERRSAERHEGRVKMRRELTGSWPCS